MTPITIVWRPKLADFRHAIHKGWWGTPAAAFRSLALFFVLPAVVFGLLLRVNLSPEMWLLASAAFGLLCGGVLPLAMTWWLARVLLKRARAKSDFQEIVLTEDGIERRIKDTRIRHLWTAVSRVEEDKRLFLLIGPSGPVTTIEKSGIGSKEELVRVRAFLRDRKPGRYLGDSAS